MASKVANHPLKMKTQHSYKKSSHAIDYHNKLQHLMNKSIISMPCLPQYPRFTKLINIYEVWLKEGFEVKYWCFLGQKSKI